MESNNLILIFFIVSFSLLFFKYFPLILSKFNSKLLVDDQFDKPQAFHEFPVSISGGLGIYLSFLILFLYLFLSSHSFNYEYLSLCTMFFILGFSDDINLNIRPKFRLLLMIIILISLIIFNEFYIENTGIDFLNRFLQIDIFALFFVCLCFLFIINGSNLIDGYNGLLSIHALIILVNLFFINYFNNNSDLAFIILCGIAIIIVFLKYNIPKATIFLGDSGSYLLAFIFGYFFIKMYNQSTTIKVDHIVLFMIIPGIDLIRLFITRII